MCLPTKNPTSGNYISPDCQPKPNNAIIPIMNRATFFVLCVFGCMTIILFLGGLLEVTFLVKNINNNRKVERLGVTGTATITKVVSRTRTLNNKYYFTIENDTEIYSVFLLKILSSNIKSGDKIKVIFSEDKKIFLFINFLSSIYVGYIIDIVLALLFFVLFIFFLLGTIEIYKKRTTQ
jgi:hypothetical protein